MQSCSNPSRTVNYSLITGLDRCAANFDFVAAILGVPSLIAPSPSISFLRWRVDGLKLGVMHRSRVISGMGSSGDTGQRDRGLGGRD